MVLELALALALALPIALIEAEAERAVGLDSSLITSPLSLSESYHPLPGLAKQHSPDAH